MRAWLGVSWSLGLAVGSVVACTQSSSTFPCYADEMCTSGPLQGICEDVGYCSFPDLDCPSHRRFGESSPADLAGQCVEADGGPTTSDTTGAGPGDDTGSTGDDTGPDGSESSTSGGPECGSVLSDDFEDGVLDPGWEPFADEGMSVDEADGVLRLTIEPGPGDRFGGVVSELRDLRGVVVEAELAPIGDQLHDEIGYWLSIGVEDCSHEIGVRGDLISGWSRGDSFSDEPIDPAQPVRVRFRVELDETVYWEYWQDDAWQTLYVDDSVCELDWGGYALFAATDGRGVVGDVYTRGIASIWACEP